MVEDVEPVAPRQFGQFGNGLRDEGHGLIGTALSIRFLWFPIPARSGTLPATPSLGQKICIQIHLILSNKYAFCGRNSRKHFATS
jgi:hypothetical protein